jgi:FG-GAP repeat
MPLLPLFALVSAALGSASAVPFPWGAAGGTPRRYNSPALSNLDQLGKSIAAIGDLDNDGNVDLAVGAPGDDDGGSDRGAVYILFLLGDGTVRSSQKISDATLPLSLNNGDEFGIAVAGFNQAGEILVGAWGDDDGGMNCGARYVIHLLPSGAVSSARKISETAWGPGQLGLRPYDSFGSALATLGDLVRLSFALSYLHSFRVSC